MERIGRFMAKICNANETSFGIMYVRELGGVGGAQQLLN